MPTSKEEIRRKYGLTDEEFDVVEALALRPTCEHCNKALPPDSLEARICTFECTFCASCVETVIGNVCPNCGGGFAPRPIRPARNWKNDNYLGAIPARKESEAQASGSGGACGFFCRDKEDPAAESLNPKVPNQADAPNPSMTRQLTIKRRWLGVGDPDR
jgi:hypothetical protein